jgi:drug/metabolite transporter (DMT)-like permease
MLTALVVIARIVTNPLSNVFQKQLAQRSAEPIFIIAATHGLLTALALPLLLGRPLDALGGPFWANMLIAVVLAVAGNVLLVYALRSADLSVLGPINAYRSATFGAAWLARWSW